MQYVTLVPAYGRDYTSKAAVLADWDAGRDFVIAAVHHPHNGRYINRQDAAQEPGTAWNVRYKRLTRIVAVPMTSGQKPKPKPKPDRPRPMTVGAVLASKKPKPKPDLIDDDAFAKMQASAAEFHRRVAEMRARRGTGDDYAYDMDGGMT